MPDNLGIADSPSGLAGADSGRCRNPRTASAPVPTGYPNLAEVLKVLSLVLERARRAEAQLQRVKDELAGCSQRALGYRWGMEMLEVANERLRREVEELRGLKAVFLQGKSQEGSS